MCLGLYFATMASHVPAAAENHYSAAQYMEATKHDSKITNEEACAGVQPLKMSWLDRPILKRLPGGRLHVSEMPLRMLANSGASLGQLADILFGELRVSGENIDAMMPFLLDWKYKYLQRKFALRTEPSIPYSMQLFVIQDAHNTTTIVKHIMRQPNKFKRPEC